MSDVEAVGVCDHVTGDAARRRPILQGQPVPVATVETARRRCAGSPRFLRSESARSVIAEKNIPVIIDPIDDVIERMLILDSYPARLSFSATGNRLTPSPPH